MEGLENAAIRAALCGNWPEAVTLNLKILKKNKKDIASLNRLTRAYIELGKKTLAKNTLNIALKIDPYNQIAQKLKSRLLSKSPISHKTPNSPTPTTFIEEPGKTQTLNLVNLAPPKILATLECAQIVCLSPRHHSVHVSVDNRYLGALPDDIGKRLYTLIKNGNCYEAFIKSVDSQNLTIFIRELSRCKRYHALSSFSPKSDTTYRHLEEPTEHQHEDDEEASVSKSIAIHQDEEPEEGA
ncbi:MAG: hypothetical protein AAB506_01800 [Patescibacteria group bacterium]